MINEISGKMNDKTGVVEYLDIDGLREYSAQRICNRFAKYFAGVGKKFSEKIPTPTKPVKDYLKLMQSSQGSLF